MGFKSLVLGLGGLYGGTLQGHIGCMRGLGFYIGFRSFLRR